MLGQRILTAVVLLALLLPALFASTTWPFALLMLVLIAAAAWEWARLNGQSTAAAWTLALLLAGAGALFTWSQAGAVAPQWWWAGAVLWLLGGAWALRGGPQSWPGLPLWLRLAVGMLALWLAWLAIAQARARGVNFVLSALCIVFVADICAYAAGRAIGKHKLAPSISPGKTWEGVAGGVIGVAVLALVWTLGIDTAVKVDSASVFSALHAAGGWAWLAFGVALLTALSVVGDLCESLVKRSVGAKDSSRLLPGHGGVLDRIDAQLPVLPMVLALLSL